MKSILPSKKKVITAIFTLLILIIGFFALGYGDSYLDKDKLSKEDKGHSAIDQAMGSLSKDSDNDGLKDWEEVLWKTDPNNPDTDLDGTSDGEEVKLGRDPIKPRPDDKLEEKVVSSVWQSAYQGADINTSGTPLNLTELFAKNLGLQTSNGINPLGDDNQDLLNRANSSTEILLKDFIASFHPNIPVEDLIILKDNNTETIRKYDSDMAKVFGGAPYPSKTEEEIFMKALDTRDFSVIDLYIEYYKDIVNRSMAVSVPSDFSAIHKRGIELMLGTIEAYKSIKEIDNDPIKTIIGIQEYQPIKEELYNLIIESDNLIEKSLIN